MTNRALRAISGAVAAVRLLSLAGVSLAQNGLWDGSVSPAYDSYETGNNWYFGGIYRNPEAGDNLIINSGLANFQPASIDTNLILSTSSTDGQTLTVNGGTFQTRAPPGQTGHSGGSGLWLDSGSSLTVDGTGTVSLAGEFAVGFSAGSSATAVISQSAQLLVGQDLTDNLDPTFYDGFFGNGLVMQTGGTVSSYDMAIGGLNSTSQGNYQLQNGTSTVTTGTYVGGTAGGATGAGTLNITGGTFTTGTLQIWSPGSVIVNGGALTATTINQNGGTVDLSGGTLSCGSLAVSGGVFSWTRGTLNLTNPTIGNGSPLGSSLTLGSGQILQAAGLELYVNGTLSLNNGAQAQGVGASTDAYIGSSGGANVSVNGDGSTLSAFSVLDVGYENVNSGTLSLNNGGQATSSYVGIGGSVSGTATVTGSGSTLTASTELIIGNDMTSADLATLSISGGGKATSPAVYIGDGSGFYTYGTGGASNVVVSGSASVLVAGTYLYVGFNGYPGTGTLTLSNGGQASSGGYVVIGAEGGIGSVTIGSAGTTDSGAALTCGGSIYVGGDTTSSFGSFGTGLITVYAGATLSAGGTLKIWNSVADIGVNLAGGTIQAATLDTSGNSGLFDWTAGALEITGSIINTPTIGVPSGGKLIFEPSTTAVTTLNSLSISSAGVVDLNNNHIFINYGSGPDPIASIAAWIASGFAAGAWTGTGIMSTAAQSNSGSYGIGYADSADPGNPANLASGTIEIMYTLLGDANLDGKVNGTDFNLMATNFNQAVTDGWDEGDFNYDGKVNGNDFVLLAENFNQFASQSAVTTADWTALENFAAANGISLENVPEPASAGLLGMVGLGILRRRRRFS